MFRKPLLIILFSLGNHLVLCKNTEAWITVVNDTSIKSDSLEFKQSNITFKHGNATIHNDKTEINDATIYKEKTDGNEIGSLHAFSKEGLGGDREVQGTFKVDYNVNPHETISCDYDMDYNSSPTHLQVTCGSSTGLLAASYTLDKDAGHIEYGTVHISYSNRILPFHITAIGLGKPSITVCGQTPQMNKDGIFLNPCSGSWIGETVTVKFSASPKQCSFKLYNRMDKTIAGNSSGNIIARYFDKHSSQLIPSFMFLCQQESPGDPSCPWVHTQNSDHFAAMSEVY